MKKKAAAKARKTKPKLPAPKKPAVRAVSKAKPASKTKPGSATRVVKKPKPKPTSRPAAKPSAKTARPKRDSRAAQAEVLFRGQHLQLLSRNGWEMCERVNTTGVVTIVAVTADRRLLLTEQFRPPLRRRVIEMPAGLAGDISGQENEGLAVAARRELLEETGYECERMDFLAEGPSSSGLTSEIITFFRATGLRWVGPGGGDGTEDIQLHSIPLSWIRGWLRERETAGILVDPKVYAGLYFLGPG